MPDPHHPKSPLMEAVDREAELLAQRYGGFVPGAALATAMRNILAAHDREIAQLAASLASAANPRQPNG